MHYLAWVGDRHTYGIFVKWTLIMLNDTKKVIFA
jgi:hypothetical protein